MITDILLEVRNHLSDRDNWCQNKWRDEAGRMCVMEAVYKFSPDYLTAGKINFKLSDVAVDMFTMATLGVNDRLGYESVMALLDETIQREKNAN